MTSKHEGEDEPSLTTPSEKDIRPHGSAATSGWSSAGVDFYFKSPRAQLGLSMKIGIAITGSVVALVGLLMQVLRS